MNLIYITGELTAFKVGSSASKFLWKADMDLARPWYPPKHGTEMVDRFDSNSGVI
jgi:hypothetical protein